VSKYLRTRLVGDLQPRLCQVFHIVLLVSCAAFRQDFQESRRVRESIVDFAWDCAEYDRPCPCSVALYADIQSWEEVGQALSRKRVVVGALDE
jgi:hypothetical protein